MNWVGEVGAVCFLAVVCFLWGFSYGEKEVQLNWLSAYHSLKQSKIDCWKKDHNDKKCLTRDVIKGIEFEDIQEK